METMVNHRPCRAARPFGEAVAPIKAEAAAGKLDQQIVDACIAVFEQKKFSFAHTA